MRVKTGTLVLLSVAMAIVATALYVGTGELVFTTIAAVVNTIIVVIIARRCWRRET